MRLIDADKLTDRVIHDMAIGALHSNAKYFSLVNDIVIAFRRMIKDAPTIDAEPVVRCKECIKNIRNTDGVDEDWCYKFGYEIDETNFCSYGERREP